MKEGGQHPRSVSLARTSGYCGGVAAACRLAYRLLEEWPERRKAKKGSAELCMLGELIHNRLLIDDLIDRGMVLRQTVAEIPENATALIRAHGLPPSDYAALDAKGCVIEDATCPYVKQIHRLAAAALEAGKQPILIGDPQHPEIIGINGACDGKALIFDSFESVQTYSFAKKSYVLLSQTTFSQKEYEKICDFLKNKIASLEIFATICGATENRQAEAGRLARQVDVMLVIGSDHSSNTRKLLEVCRVACGENYLVETPEAARQLMREGRLYDKNVGVTAGASSPESIIREVIHIMNENVNETTKSMAEQNEQAMTAEAESARGGETVNQAVAAETPQETESASTVEQAEAPLTSEEKPAEVSAEVSDEAAGKAEVPTDETASAAPAAEKTQDAPAVLAESGDISFTDAIDSIPQLKRGATVKGVIVRYDSEFVYVDVRDKSEGKIPIHEFAGNPDFNLDEAVSEHREIDVYVRSIRNTEMGKEILLSKARVDFGKYKALVEEAYNNKTPITVKVVNVVKDGVIATYGGIDIYIHRTQLELGIVQDLEPYRDQELEILVTQFDPDRRRLRVSGSRRQLLNRDRKKKAEELWNAIAVGDVYEGVVRSLTDFGAFVDIGGVDGLVHISELSWSRIKHPSEVVKVGDVVQVYIKDFDREAKRIKLGYKRIEDDPYHDIESRFPVGSIVHGKVMRMVNFGVFIAIADGVDAFCHISQISSGRLNRPEDVLSEGMEVDARVIDVRNGEHRVGVSIKEVAPIDAPHTEPSEPKIRTRKNRSNEEVPTSYTDAGQHGAANNAFAAALSQVKVEADEPQVPTDEPQTSTDESPVKEDAEPEKESAPAKDEEPETSES